MMKHLYYLSLVLLCVACGPKAPTDEQLKDLCRNAAFVISNLEEGDKGKAFQEVVVKNEQNYDIQKISPSQVELLFDVGGASLDSYLREWLAPILETQSKQSGEAGAIASYYRWRYVPMTGFEEIAAKETELYKLMLTNTSIGSVLSGNEKILVDVLKGAAHVGGDSWVESGILDNVKSLLDMSLSDDAVFASMEVFNAAFVAEKISTAEKEEIRQKVLKQYTGLLSTERYREGRRRARVELAIQYLEGPYATGTLVGNKAPELNFLWMSSGKEKSLDDLKGKVVILDFWATKCGPCIGIMPNMRALTKRYTGYPVEIIGVTSVMGYHVDVKNGKTIQTKGNPEYEFELMRTFMKDQNMNWRVAFTSQNVMNMDYGVLDIPHIVIIDAKGNVRYNGVDPFSAPYHKADLIDGLLKEAGLRCPAAPMEKTDYSKKLNE
jgi:probable thioredoxin